MADSFWGQEVKGKRLTEQGWGELTESCIRQWDFPGKMIKVHVISSPSRPREDERLRTDDFAAFWTEYWEYGELDANMRFVVAPSRSPDGVMLLGNVTTLYALLTNEVDPHGDVPTGRKAWKILEPPRDVSIDLVTAIQYVTRVRDGAKSRVIRSNAQKTLVSLAELEKWERKRRK